TGLQLRTLLDSCLLLLTKPTLARVVRLVCNPRAADSPSATSEVRSDRAARARVRAPVADEWHHMGTRETVVAHRDHAFACQHEPRRRHGDRCRGLWKNHVDPAPRLIVHDMPPVPTTAFALLGEQDGPGGDRAGLTEPRLELQRAAERDDVLPHRIRM